MIASWSDIEWGNAAEWITGLVTAAAVAVTALGLTHERKARHVAEDRVNVQNARQLHVMVKGTPDRLVDNGPLRWVWRVRVENRSAEMFSDVALRISTSGGRRMLWRLDALAAGTGDQTAWEPNEPVDATVFDGEYTYDRYDGLTIDRRPTSPTIVASYTDERGQRWQRDGMTSSVVPAETEPTEDGWAVLDWDAEIW